MEKYYTKNNNFERWCRRNREQETLKYTFYIKITRKGALKTFFDKLPTNLSKLKHGLMDYNRFRHTNFDKELFTSYQQCCQIFNVESEKWF